MPNINSGYGPGGALTTTADPAGGSGLALMQALIGDRKVDYEDRRANRLNERPRGSAGASGVARQAGPLLTRKTAGNQLSQGAPMGYEDAFEPTFGTLESGGLGRIGGAYMPYNGGPASANSIAATGFRRPGTGMKPPTGSAFVSSEPPPRMPRRVFFEDGSSDLV